MQCPTPATAATSRDASGAHAHGDNTVASGARVEPPVPSLAAFLGAIAALISGATVGSVQSKPIAEIGRRGRGSPLPAGAARIIEAGPTCAPHGLSHPRPPARGQRLTRGSVLVAVVPSPARSLPARLRIALWRARLRAADVLGLRPSFDPPPAVARDQLAALAMLWDGRWFLKTAEAHGVEDAVARNSAVRVSFARTEMKLLLAALGRDRARDLDEAARMIRAHGHMLFAPAGGLEYEQRSEPDGALSATVTRCAAFEGAREAKRRNLVPREDQACVHCCDVWRAWYGVLLPGTDVDVERGEYQGAGAARCEFRFRAR